MMYSNFSYSNRICKALLLVALCLLVLPTTNLAQNLSECQRDDCGVCDGNNRDKGCDGICFSGKVNDDCGVCGGANKDLGCDGQCFSGKEIDDCGVCGANNRDKGCDGICFSDKTTDDCGVCDGGNKDKGCDGQCFSGKIVDECGLCGGSGPGACGCDTTIQVDACGVCNGNGPGACGCDSEITKDSCGVCGGTGPGECGCDLSVTKDRCGVCGGNNECETPDICEDVEPKYTGTNYEYQHGDKTYQGKHVHKVFVCLKGNYTFRKGEGNIVLAVTGPDGTEYGTRYRPGKGLDNPFAGSDLAQQYFSGGNNSPLIWNDHNNAKRVELDEQYKVEDKGEVCWTCAWVRVRGCFAPETTVLMSNGEEKAISDIRKGDFVRNPVTNKSVEVEFVMQSSEQEPMIDIITINGKSLKVTQKHPIKTKTGIKQASKLKIGDLVEVANGDFEQVVSAQNLEVINQQTVYNLMLNADSDDLNDHMVLADGVVAGDQYAQEKTSN